MKYEDNPRSIKYHVKKYFYEHRDEYKGKKVVDFPAGNGITSKIIKDIGGIPLPFDLFPEYFNVDGLTCQRANINQGIPLEDQVADALICQEGIEHFSDQLLALKAFNRVLKKEGKLIITTPNYSNLRAKVSYLLSESERFNSILAPNELDSIWMSQQGITKEIYYGHIFLTGILKLRCLAKLAGFKIKKIHFTRLKTTSLLFLIPLYPFIWFSNFLTYKKRLRKNKEVSDSIKKAVYKEIFRLSVDPKILTDGHLFVEFEKECEVNEVAETLNSQHQAFGLT